MSKKKRKQRKLAKQIWKRMEGGANGVLANTGVGPAAGQGNGLFAGLTRLLPSRPSDQFLVGAAIGAVAAFVLTDEELRGKIMRSGIKLYSSVMGGIEEMKEQAADLQAELDAQQNPVP